MDLSPVGPVMVTLAPDTTASDGSRTTPLRLPFTYDSDPCCANPNAASESSSASIANPDISFFCMEFSSLNCLRGRSLLFQGQMGAGRCPSVGQIRQMTRAC